MTAGKRIGILTSGGDCAGLNAVIRAVVHRAVLTYGWQVLGIKEGTQGLLQRPVQYQVLDLPQVDGNMMRMGGTILGTTNRGDPFAYPMADGTQKDRSDEIIGGYRELGLDALIGIGGDGSFAILKKLADKGGFQMVGIPKTIDNDLGLTEVSVGYDTAVGVAVEALDRLQPTAASHARVMVLEVMGRDAGHIALAAGIAGGADVVLIPEIAYSIEKIAQKIKQVRSTGRNFALVVVSEAVKTVDGTGVQKLFQGGQKRYGGIGDYIGEKIAEATGAETRVTVLGHVQRGSMPSPRDRLVASAFGVHAVDLIAEGKFDRMVAWSDRGVIDVPITEAIAKYACVELDGAMVKTARGLGISLGD
ncbi:ATP-dependent 6-phosphofructokinase [Azospirillum brasilense]|uniref:ATP-dependent 6-phosphofructokinase n=5 Tax=Azospirillum TaxID=191 RepID=A0AQW8_AZOBR|nr:MULTISPECIES: ATP-dependent 6-phosphofructokinase [Azospirillum]AIB12210.1 6-phosphofructokinase [Azospirillum argentinense]ALJ34851.1 6-phosphofructokinase [Azospirillum brasilense]AWJ90278.1 6-phosphofructokinase [Azospirillum baldaniorum]EZQ09065.1 6-phosphofructokinase [Azospirillum argentinense]KAA1054649.1 6-phosphofructokinase [Azospirillum argentinense]